VKAIVGVPTQAILNANPTYIRRDMGDLDALERSIKRSGLQAKVLLAANFEIVDGARRVEVLRRLGIAEVPAVATDDWLQVHSHMIRTRELERLCPDLVKPLDWDEVNDLYWGVYHRLYEPVRFLEQGNGPRRIKRHKYTDHLKKYGEGVKYSRYLNQVADMLGLAPANVSNSTRIASVSRAAKFAHPERVSLIDEVLNGLRGAGVEHLYGPLRVLGELRDNGTPPAPDRRRAERQLKTLRAALTVLDTVTAQMLEIGELDDTLTVNEINELRIELRETQLKANKTRNKFRARLAKEGFTEERESTE
jgi:ParB-like nuclease domain